MIRSLAAGAGAAMLTFVLMPAASAGDGPADSIGCVTRTELRSIRTDTTGTHGTRKLRVHHIFDTRGERIGEGEGFITRAYERCGRHRLDDAVVDYSRSSGVWRAAFASFADLPSAPS